MVKTLCLKNDVNNKCSLLKNTLFLWKGSKNLGEWRYQGLENSMQNKNPSNLIKGSLEN